MEESMFFGRNVTVALLLGSLSVVGCAKKAPPVPERTVAAQQALAATELPASCNKRVGLSLCSDFTAPAMASGEKALAKPCGLVKGTFAKEACPSDNVVGSCGYGNGEVKRYYADGQSAYTAVTAKRACALSEGVWAEKGQKVAAK
jgi:hypothetical protein